MQLSLLEKKFTGYENHINPHKVRYMCIMQYYITVATLHLVSCKELYLHYGNRFCYNENGI